MTPALYAQARAAPDRVQRPRAPDPAFAAAAGAACDGAWTPERRSLARRAATRHPASRDRRCRAGSRSWATAAARIVSRAARGFAMAAKPCCGWWCARAATVCRDRPTRRCAGRREHRHDDHPALTRLGRQQRPLAGRGRLPGVVGHVAGGLAAARAGAPRSASDRGRLLLHDAGDELAVAPANCDCNWRAGRDGRATSAVLPAALEPGADDDPLAAGAGAGDRPTCRAGCCCRPPPACVAGWRCRPPRPNACATWSASRSTGRRRSPPMRSRSTRASSAAATATASSMSNWSWCRAPALRRRSWPRSARWPHAWPASTSPTAAARRCGVNLLPPAQRRQHADPWRLLELGAGRRRRCSRSPRCLWQMLDNRRAAADAFERTDRRSAPRRRARRRSSASSWSTLVEGQRLPRPARARPPDRGRGPRRTQPPPARQHLPGKARDRERPAAADRPEQRGLGAGRPAGRLELWRAPALTGALQPDPRTRPRPLHPDRRARVITAAAPRRRKEAADAAARPLTATAGWRWACCSARSRWPTCCWCIRGGRCRCSRPATASPACSNANCARACSCSRRRRSQRRLAAGAAAAGRAARASCPKPPPNSPPPAWCSGWKPWSPQASPGNRSCAITNRSPLAEPQPRALRRGDRAGAPALRHAGTGRGAACAGKRHAAAVRRQPQHPGAALLLPARAEPRRRAAGWTSASTCTATCGRADAPRGHGGDAVRVDSAGPRTWLLATLAGWALLAWLLALLGMGGRIAPLADDPALLQPLAAAARRRRRSGSGRWRSTPRSARARCSPTTAGRSRSRCSPKARAKPTPSLRLRPDQRADHAGPADGDPAAHGRRRLGPDQARRSRPKPQRLAPGALESAQRGVRRARGREARSTCACSTAPAARRRPQVSAATPPDTMRRCRRRDGATRQRRRRRRRRHRRRCASTADAAPPRRPAPTAGRSDDPRSADGSDPQAHRSAPRAVARSRRSSNSTAAAGQEPVECRDESTPLFRHPALAAAPRRRCWPRCASMPAPTVQRDARIRVAAGRRRRHRPPTASTPTQAAGTPRPTPARAPQIRRGTGQVINRGAASAPPPNLGGSSGAATFNFEGESLHAVVKAILGDMLGQNYVIAPGVQGTVTLATPKPVSPAEALQPAGDGAGLEQRPHGLQRRPLQHRAGRPGAGRHRRAAHRLARQPRAASRSRVVPLRYISASRDGEDAQALRAPQRDRQRRLRRAT